MHDCGRLINPMIVAGQVHGGVAQGIGGALYETMAYDENGQLLNASFMDFLMPYVTEIPQRELGQLELGHQETPSPLNPLGIKGAGEAGVIPVSALIASAVEDAMGIGIDAMPLNPDLLFRLHPDRSPSPPRTMIQPSRWPQKEDRHEGGRQRDAARGRRTGSGGRSPTPVCWPG